MASAAYLRVYLPEEELTGYPEHHAAPGLGVTVMVSDQHVVWHESDHDDAFVAEVDGRRYICPRTPRLRMLEGLIAFRRSYPGATASLLVPEPLADSAEAELAHFHEHHPDERSHILTSPFYVPLRWFSAFDPAERELVDRPEGLSIRYRTRLGAAIRRLERAVAVLDGVGFDDSIIDEVRDMARWLGGFPEHALAELDYGGTARLFSDAELALDETCAEVHASLAALEHGDLEEAGDHYAEAAGRWAHAQALTYAN